MRVIFGILWVRLGLSGSMIHFWCPVPVKVWTTGTGNAQTLRQTLPVNWRPVPVQVRTNAYRYQYRYHSRGPHGQTTRLRNYRFCFVSRVKSLKLFKRYTNYTKLSRKLGTHSQVAGGTLPIPTNRPSSPPSLKIITFSVSFLVRCTRPSLD